MVCCEICRTTITDSPSNKEIQCSGPCRKAFHAFCADLNQSYWRAWAAKVGLLWFCPGCRETFGEKDEKAALETGKGKDEEEGEVSALELLPAEIWIKVFRSLSGYQLRQIRMTCRSWNEIVGSSSSLMSKLMLRLPKNIILDEDCEEVELLSSRKSRYSNIVMEQIRIIRVEPWWTAIADNLESLSISKSQITIDTLLTMLEPLHNLKHLSFSCGPFVDTEECPTDVHFQLPSVEQLILKDVDEGALLDVFRQICPNLKGFLLPTGACTESQPQKVVQLIEAVKGTLEDVELPMSLRLWQTIDVVKGLHLKRIALTDCKENLAMNSTHLLDLIKKHPNIEGLFLCPMYYSLEGKLQIIGNHLTNLQHLQISLNRRDESISSSFLQRMPQLNRFQIIGNEYYYGTKFTFVNLKSYNITTLNIFKLKITQNYTNSFPNVTHMFLKECTVPSWSYIFNPKLKSLQQLTLKSVKVDKSGEDCLAAHFNRLQSLSIAECNVSKSLLIAVFSLSPNLTTVRLFKLDELDDAVVSVLCKKSKNLTRVTVKDCRETTQLSREYIEKHGQRVEFSHFSNRHARVEREEYDEDYYDYDYSCGHEFVYDYSF